jgi:hypothetical protein
MIDIEQFLMSLRRHKDVDGKLKPIYLADTLQEEITIIQEAVKHSQRWVSLTDEEIENFLSCLYPLPEKPVKDRLRVLEAELREKNGG